MQISVRKFHHRSVPLDQSIVLSGWETREIDKIQPNCIVFGRVSICLYILMMNIITYIKWIIFISCSRQCSANDEIVWRSCDLYWLKFTETVHKSQDIAIFDHKIHICAQFEIVSFSISQTRHKSNKRIDDCALRARAHTHSVVHVGHTRFPLLCACVSQESRNI